MTRAATGDQLGMEFALVRALRSAGGAKTSESRTSGLRVFPKFRSRLGAFATRMATAAVMVWASWGSGAAAGEPRVEVVARGLEVPWAIAFAPDGRLLVTERPGRLRVVKDGRLGPTPLATIAVAAVGEAGLMGLALDPAFPANGHVYICYTASTAQGYWAGC